MKPYPMSSPSWTPSPVVPDWLFERLSRAVDILNGDLVIVFHPDRSGHVEFTHNKESVFTFDTLPELAGWLDDFPPRPVPQLVHRRMSNACVGGFHNQCLHGPGQPCHCACHVRPTNPVGGDAA